MRIFKFSVLVVILAVLGFFAYLFISSATWYSSTRRESVRVLTTAQSVSELTNAVGYLGWFVQLANHEWFC